jgi:hypothetical protein
MKLSLVNEARPIKGCCYVCDRPWMSDHLVLLRVNIFFEASGGLRRTLDTKNIQTFDPRLTIVVVSGYVWLPFRPSLRNGSVSSDNRTRQPSPLQILTHHFLLVVLVSLPPHLLRVVSFIIPLEV